MDSCDPEMKINVADLVRIMHSLMVSLDHVTKQSSEQFPEHIRALLVFELSKFIFLELRAETAARQEE